MNSTKRIIVVFLCCFAMMPCLLVAESIPSVVKQIQLKVKEISHLEADKIMSYTYKGNTVYLAIMPCCDHFDILFNAKYETICSLGGFTGGGDGKCADFKSLKKDGKTLWSKSNNHS